jgi:hypothetical protein
MKTKEDILRRIDMEKAEQKQIEARLDELAWPTSCQEHNIPYMDTERILGESLQRECILRWILEE